MARREGEGVWGPGRLALGREQERAPGFARAQRVGGVEQVSVFEESLVWRERG